VQCKEKEEAKNSEQLGLVCLQLLTMFSIIFLSFKTFESVRLMNTFIISSVFQPFSF